MTQTPIPRSSQSLNVKLRFHVLLYNTMQIYSLSLELPISRSPLSVEPRLRSCNTHFIVFYSPLSHLLTWITVNAGGWLGRVNWVFTYSTANADPILDSTSN